MRRGLHEAPSLGRNTCLGEPAAPSRSHRQHHTEPATPIRRRGRFSCCVRWSSRGRKRVFKRSRTKWRRNDSCVRVRRSTFKRRFIPGHAKLATRSKVGRTRRRLNVIEYTCVCKTLSMTRRHAVCTDLVYKAEAPQITQPETTSVAH